MPTTRGLFNSHISDCLQIAFMNSKYLINYYLFGLESIKIFLNLFFFKLIKFFIA